MIIGLDVDGVVVDTVTPFLEQGEDLEYWKNSTLYDNLKPHDEIYLVLDILENYGEVIFLTSSHCEHLFSKKKFLNYYFEGVDVVNIKNKEFFPVDILIDDRDIVLEKFKEKNPDSKVIKATYGNVLEAIKKAGF